MTEKNSNSGIIVLGVAIALGLVIAAFVMGGAVKDLKYANRFITVKGYAEKNITSDLGIWKCVLSITTADLPSGYDKIQSDLSKVISFMQSNGISKEKIAVNPINTVINYRRNPDGSLTGERGGYILEQNLTITSNDVNLIDRIARESSSLMRQGIEFQSFPPEYYFTKMNNMKIQMLGEATKDAKTRAEQIAKFSDNEVGSLKAAQQGVFQITPVNSQDVSDYGMYDQSTIAKTIKAVVTIDYYLK